MPTKTGFNQISLKFAARPSQKDSTSTLRDKSLRAFLKEPLETSRA